MQTPSYAHRPHNIAATMRWVPLFNAARRRRKITFCLAALGLLFFAGFTNLSDTDGADPYGSCPTLRLVRYRQRELRLVAANINSAVQASMELEGLTFGSFEQKESSAEAVKTLWHQEQCVVAAAEALGVRPFELQARPEDQVLCDGGVWRGGCTGGGWQFAPYSELARIEHSAREMAVSAVPACLGRRSVFAFNMVVSDASWKGFPGLDLIKETMKYISDEPAFILAIHVDAGSSKDFRESLQSLIHTVGCQRIALTPTSLRSSWGSGNLAAAEFLGLAALINLARKQDLCFEHVVNMDGATMFVKTPEEVKARLSALVAGSSYLDGLPTASIYRKNATFLGAPEGFHVPAYIKHSSGPSPAIRAQLAGWPGPKQTKYMSQDDFRFYNMTAWRASQWRVISRGMAEYLITSPAVSTFYDQFARYLFAPDECLIPTIYKSIAAPMENSNDTHYIASRANGNGRRISSKDFPNLLNGSAILARKFPSIKQWQDYVAQLKLDIAP